ncbi:MAG TPA: hypothetical protein VJX94_25485, partial [Stellaceae bacterium]|nr:hypothetical protein [Stellaceae bacterium]
MRDTIQCLGSPAGGRKTTKIAFLPPDRPVCVKKYNIRSTGWIVKFVTRRINGIFSANNEFLRPKRIKSFRVARRCESSVGLTWIGARRRGMEFSGGLRGGEMAGRAGMR